MENWHKLWNLLQNQTALQIGPNRTGVMAYAELFWLRRRWRKMKKVFPKVLVLTTMMDWMTRKENTMKKTTKPTILPQKQALLRKITENAQKGSLVDCQEDVPYTALTIVCTINVSIDCDCFDVSNPPTRKNIHKRKSSQ